MKQIIFSLVVSVLITSCTSGDQNKEVQKQIDASQVSELDLQEDSSNGTPSFFVSAEMDSKILNQICESHFNEDGLSLCDQMDLAIKKVTTLDSVFIVESYCSCGSPCLIKMVSTFNKKGKIIDVVEVYTECDCPDECEGCGWNNLDIMSQTTFQITRVTEEITPKYDPKGNEIEFECNIIRNYKYEFYEINPQGVFTITDSFTKIENNPFPDIHSDTTIILENILYELNEPIRIVGQRNIIIEGSGAQLSANSLVSDVIYIENSENITLKNFHATHLDPSGPMGCTGNVINIQQSKNISIDQCDLNGSGIVGVAAYFVDSLKIKNSHIHENSSYGVIFQGKHLELENNTFESNGYGNLYFSYLESDNDYTWPPKRLINSNENIQGLIMKENTFIEDEN